MKYQIIIILTVILASNPFGCLDAQTKDNQQNLNFDSKLETQSKQKGTWAIGIYGGTLGTGLTIAKSMGPKLSLRLGSTYLPMKFTLNEFYEETNTDFDIRFLTADFKLDYYISNKIKNPFHFIFGGMYNGSKVKTTVRPSLEKDIVFGNQTIARDNVGTVSVEVKPQKFNAFLGVGVGRLVHHKKRLGIKFELGGVFTGYPKVDLNATGIVAPTAQQEEQLEHNFRRYYIYPGANLYLSLKL